jgi:beta-lactamase class A
MQAIDHVTVELPGAGKLTAVLRLFIVIVAVASVIPAKDGAASFAGKEAAPSPRPRSSSPSRTASEPTQLLEQIHSAVATFKGVMGVAARNLGTGEELLVNADLRFPSASTIKTAVMVEAYHQAAEGKLPLDTPITLRDADKVGGSGVLNGFRDGATLRVADLIHLMIVVSDNTATNLLVNRLGTAAIDERLAAHGRANTKIFRPTFA